MIGFTKLSLHQDNWREMFGGQRQKAGNQIPDKVPCFPQRGFQSGLRRNPYKSALKVFCKELSISDLHKIHGKFSFQITALGRKQLSLGVSVLGREVETHLLTLFKHLQLPKVLGVLMTNSIILKTHV